MIMHISFLLFLFICFFKDISTYYFFSGTRVSLDDIAKKDIMKSSGRPKTAFGSKKIESVTPTSRMVTLSKKKTDKENKSVNQSLESPNQSIPMPEGKFFPHFKKSFKIQH